MKTLILPATLALGLLQGCDSGPKPEQLTILDVHTAFEVRAVATERASAVFFNSRVADSAGIANIASVEVKLPDSSEWIALTEQEWEYWTDNDAGTLGGVFISWSTPPIAHRYPIQGYALRITSANGKVAETDFELRLPASEPAVSTQFFYHAPFRGITPYEAGNTEMGVPSLGFVTLDNISLSDEYLNFQAFIQDTRVEAFQIEFLRIVNNEAQSIAHTRLITRARDGFSAGNSGFPVELALEDSDSSDLQGEDPAKLSDATHYHVSTFGALTPFDDDYNSLPWARAQLLFEPL